MAAEKGTPQGAVISPLLANIYLHYVHDLWAHQWRRRHATGQVIIVRYADDSVFGFERREDAESFLAALRERMAQFGLNLHPDKTRLIEFGRRASTNRQQRGEGKPETFDFLGFTHCCGKTRKGWFKLLRVTVKKRMRATLNSIRDKLRRKMHTPYLWSENGRGGWCRVTSITLASLETSFGCALFGVKSVERGGKYCCGAVNVIICPGRDLPGW